MSINTRFWTLMSTALLLVFSTGVGPSNPKQPVAPSRDEMRKILARGHENRTRWRHTKDEATRDALEAGLRPILGAARLGLQEIPTGRGDQVRFARVVLNSTGAGFDAVRFRTPATGEEFQILCEIVVPGNDETKNLICWNLVGVDGPAPSINEFSRRDNFELPGAGFPEENFCITPYSNGPLLRPGSEYLLWFDLKNEQPTPVFVKVRLTPSAETPPPRMAGVAKARGKFQASLGAINQRYDVELKGLRGAYLAELDKAGKAAAQRKDVAEADRITAEAVEVVRADAEIGDRRGFRVLRAYYGIDERWIDVTDQLLPLVRGNALRFGLGTDFSFKTDPAFGVVKRLIIVYSLDGNTGVSITADKQRVELPPTGPMLDRIPSVGSYQP